MTITNINLPALYERTAGDSELIRDLLDLIIVEKQNYQNQMKHALIQHDLLSLASEAHKMKSAVAVLGFDNLAEEIADMEKNALKKTIGFDFDNKINCIFISLNEHIIELENYLKK
jgi:HPt (histidine-containing phosphotransfer) domain-containing protein